MYAIQESLDLGRSWFQNKGYVNRNKVNRGDVNRNNVNRGDVNRWITVYEIT